jgi:hypothetical protein
MLKVVGTYTFNVVGDGVDTEMIIPLEALNAPSPIDQDRIPTELVGLSVAQNPGPPGSQIGGTVTLENGTFAHIVFDSPPPAGQATEVTITALFGAERI